VLCYFKTKTRIRFVSLIYIQIRTNKITVRNIETQQEITGSALFTTERLLVGQFFPAEKLLRELAQQVMPRFNTPFNRPSLLVHALDMFEGGLSQIEDRVLKEITARTAFRNSGLVVYAGERTLSDMEAKAIFEQYRNN